MNTNLIKAVINGLHCDDLEELTGTLEDIVNHGIDGGFGDFIYYSDTVKFFLDNRDEIIDLVKEEASEFDTKNIEFVSTFVVLRGNDWTDEIGRAIYGVIDNDDVTIPNALTWFAAEEVARYLVDNPELIKSYL
jgi:hypothetical protein